MSSNIDEYIDYCKEKFESFNLIEFFRYFKFGDQESAENIFQKCVGSDDKAFSNWACEISKDNFHLLNRIDVKDYWRNLSVGEAERDAKASGEVYVLNEVTLKFKKATSTPKRRKSGGSSYIEEVKNDELPLRSPRPKNRWIIDDNDISQMFFNLQVKVAKNVNSDDNDGLALEECLFELTSVQNILLLKPYQNSQIMLDVFGAEMLNTMHKSRMDVWTNGCPSFSTQEIESIQVIIDDYQLKKVSLKVAVFKLCNLTLNMDNIKTSVVDCIRRLMEKLPMREPIERCTSETEIWSTYVDPVLDSLFSSPEEGVHLRWTNKKDIQEEGERPDGIISIMSQSQWLRSFGHGEAKIAEATENYYALAWDLCRLGYFNKNIINKDNVKSSFAFQSKGHSVTFYITEPAYDGVYVMAELNSIQIPKSVNTLETLVTRRSLMRLMQIAYVFDKIKKEKKNTSQEFSGMKRDEPNLKQLLALVSEKKDRKKNSSVCF